MSKKIATKPGPFYSDNIRNIIEQGGSVTSQNYNDMSSMGNIASTSSFRYDQPGTGIKSSQQLNIDYTKFENFTFFSSAQVNVNVAFDRIINEFPFDGDNNEQNVFLDSLTGFENYVLGRFPKNKGFLHFSGTDGTSPPTDGTYIQVVDSAGNLFPELSKNKTGESVLNPDLRSFSAEMQLFVPEIVNSNQTIFQKLNYGSNSTGFSLFLSESTSTTSGSIFFGVTSGSQTMSASFFVDKGKFNHICTVLNRGVSDNLEIYLNSMLVASSSTSCNLDNFNMGASQFLIGSGTTHNIVNGGANFIPVQTLSGAIDEFRFFHSTRGINSQREFGSRNISPANDLKLYFKFNEPTGSYTSNNIALDSSGNSLHTAITNFKTSIRLPLALDNPMTAERLSKNPVLFPTDAEVVALNTLLLTSASIYDDHNPNLITRLIPSHYFLEGKAFDGFQTEAGPIVDDFTGTSIPGSGKLGTAQLISSFLYTWAKFFDDMKMAADSFSTLLHIDYDKNDNVPDQFLQFLADHYGISLPAIFKNASSGQFFEGNDLTDSFSSQANGLQYIQNEIWRRILLNINDIIRSKGTLHSIKSLIRSMGIDPDNNFRIREFGGPTKASLEVSRQFKSEVSAMLDFSGSMASVTPVLSPLGIPSNKPFVMSAFLSGSRIEAGWPYIGGEFQEKDRYPVHGISDNVNDGLFTSGSFTYEGIYKFPNLIRGSYPTNQSLARLHVTGSTTGGALGSGLGSHGVVMNLVAISGSNILRLFGRPNGRRGTSEAGFMTEMTGVNIFDGQKWNVSFGRYRHDDPDIPITYDTSNISSSYFLRCARQNFGKIVESYTTGTFFNDYEGSLRRWNGLESVEATQNASGSFIVIGSQSLGRSNIAGYLNNTTAPETARTTDFAGRVTQMRFWSKALSMKDWREHVVNFNSLGVEDPLVNFNFATQPTGAFQRMRLDTSTDQLVTSSNTMGEISVFDFSQQLTPSGTAGAPWRDQGNLPASIPYHLSGTGFDTSTRIIKPEQFYFSMISPRFDESATTEKIRPRSFLNSDFIEDYPYAQVAPVYEILRSEIPNDDTRFSIEFSVVDALNEDMIKIFGTLEKMNIAIGSPNLLFSPDYPMLEDLREVYFNRLTDKMNLKGFFEFFKWFDTTVGEMIVQLVPRKTDYLGTNFVIESHMLERAKMEYHYTDIYMGENSRSGLKGTILLRQLVGDLKRF
jgi:hypothetical protein